MDNDRKLQALGLAIANGVDGGSPHYSRFEIEPLEFIQRNGLGFCEGNIIKYVCRHDVKGGYEDLAKARHYLNVLIAHHYFAEEFGKAHAPSKVRLPETRETHAEAAESVNGSST